MQAARQKQPLDLPLPLMYLDPQSVLAYAVLRVDDPARVAELRQALAAEGAAVKLQYVYDEPTDGAWQGVAVLDLTRTRVGPADLARRVSQRPGVQTFDLQPPAEALAGLRTGRLDVAGAPVLVMAREILSDTYKWLVQSLGPPTETMLVTAGEAAGRKSAAAVPELARQFGLTVSPTVVRERFLDLQTFGWGNVVSLQVNDQFIGEAQLTGTFESLAWHNQSTQIRCYWLRGFLRGVISELEGRPYGVEEVACQAKGDPACRFDFRPQGT